MAQKYLLLYMIVQQDSVYYHDHVADCFFSKKLYFRTYLKLKICCLGFYYTWLVISVLCGKIQER